MAWVSKLDAGNVMPHQGTESISKEVFDPLVTTKSVAGRLHEMAKFYAGKGGWDDTAFALTELAKLYEDAR